MKDIIIIGSGWYGLHIANLLQNNYNITILEKNSDILSGSSSHNQNRLHLGYHYPRCSKTRNLSLKGYEKFIKKYGKLIDDFDNNYYAISKNSFIDFDTYLQIYSIPEYKHSIIKNTFLKNIDENLIKTNEKIINSNKVKSYFISKLKCNIKLNYEVCKIEKSNDKLIINDNLVCDMVFNCSNNFLNISPILNNKYIYEFTISLVYERVKFKNSFGAITLMDGNFFSIYPMDISNNYYTVTHVKYTPLKKSFNIDDIINTKIDEKKVKEIKELMETDIIKYYSDFKNEFKYKRYFCAYKCKLNMTNDSRKCNISEKNNIISINCGKITGIFIVEEYLKSKLNLNISN